MLAGGVQSLGVPPQRLGLLHRALRVIAQRAGPVHGELGAQFMADVDRVPNPIRGILAYLWRFSRRTRRPHGVKKSLGGHHGAIEPVFLQALLDAFDCLPLLILAHGFSRNHIAIVSGPVSDADLRVLANNVFKSDGLPRGRVEQRLALIRRGPLRSRDEVFAACFWAVSATTGCHETVNESLLLLHRNWLHLDLRTSNDISATRPNRGVPPTRVPLF